MLNILTTYNHHDNTEYFLEVIKNSDILKDTIYLVVPEQHAYEAELNLIEKLGDSGIFNVEVFGIKKLINRLAIDLGIENSNTITELGKKIALKSILKNENDKLKFYKNAHLSNDFIEIILTNLDSFRLDMIEPEKLQEMAMNLSIENNRLSEKLTELSYLYELYLKIVKIDAEDNYSIIEKITEKLLEKNKEHMLIVDGFSGMSNLELNLLTCFGASSKKDMYIRLLKSKIDSPVNAYIDRFIDEIKISSTNYKMPYKLINNNKSEKSNSKFFASCFSLKETFDTENIEILNTETPNEEIEHIAYNIVKKVNDNGLNYSDFAIVSSNLEKYKSNISRIFDKYEIPYYFDENISVSSSSYVNFIISSLDTIVKNFHKDDVISLMNAYSKIYKNDNDYIISEIHAHIIRKNINRNSFFSEDKWQKKFEKDIENLKNDNKILDETYTQEIENLYSEIISFKDTLLLPLKNLKEELNDKTLNTEKIINLIQNHFIELEIFEKLESEINEEENEEKVKMLQAAKKHIENTFIEIKNLSNSSNFNFTEVTEMIKYALNSFTLGKTPPNYQKVILGTLARTTFSTVKYLFIPFANEGTLPEKRNASSLIFTDKELELIENFGYHNIKNKNKFYDKELYDVFEKISKTENKVYFSYSNLDENNKAILKSSFVQTMLKKLKKETKIKSLDLYDIVDTKIKNLLIETILQNKNTYDIDKNIIEFFKNNNYNREYEIFKNANNKYEFKNNLERETNPINLSITKLDSQSICPFSYFIRYIISPQNVEKETVSSMESGNIYHSILQEFAKIFKISKDKDKILENIEDTLCNIYYEKAKEIEAFNYDNENLFRKKMLPINLKLVAQNIALQLKTNKNIDLKIYPEKSYKYEYEIDGVPITLTGIIDRLDIFESKDVKLIRVVDYKSGASVYESDKTETGLSSQLPTYLEMALKLNLNTGEVENDQDYQRQIFGMFYQTLKPENIKVDEENNTYTEEKNKMFRLDGRFIDDVTYTEIVSETFAENSNATEMKAKLKKDGKFDSNSQNISKEKFEKILTKNRKIRENLSQDIINKNFEITPCRTSNYIACKYCKYKLICRFDINTNIKKLRTIKNDE